MSKPKSGDVYILHGGSSILMVINTQTEGELKGMWIGTSFGERKEKLFCESGHALETLINGKEPFMNIDADYFKNVLLESYRNTQESHTILGGPQL